MSELVLQSYLLDGYESHSALIYNAVLDTYYGTCAQGGAYNGGVLFSFNYTTSAYNVLYHFNNSNTISDGITPMCSLTLSNDVSTLYGTCSAGGAYGGGTLFSFVLSSSTYTVLYAFGGVAQDSTNPLTGVALSTNVSEDTVLYGTCNTGGINNLGTLYIYNLSAQTYSILVNFGNGGGVTGSNPQTLPLVANITYDVGDGATITKPMLFGTCTTGGTNGQGTIYSYDINSGQFNYQFYDFGNTTNDGSKPIGNLAISNDLTTIYGTCYQGGNAYNGGILYSCVVNVDQTAATSYTILYNFNASNSTGHNPSGGVTYYNNGTNQTLYGNTFYDGNTNSGVLFSYLLNTSTYTNLAGFVYNTRPKSCVYYNPTGNLLIGTTSVGFSGSGGSIYTYILTSSTLSNIYQFKCTYNGYNLLSTPCFNTDNTLIYGSTSSGGSDGGGTVFSQMINSPYSYNQYNISFTNSTISGLVYNSLNNTYYFTLNNSDLYSINANLTSISNLQQFTENNGYLPTSLTISSTGILYGACQLQGPSGNGTLYKYDTMASSNQLTVFNVFTNAATTGSAPQSPPILSADEQTLYGVTSSGGSNNVGVLYSVHVDGSNYTVLYNFTAGNDEGNTPIGSPTLVAGFVLYGTCSQGGSIGSNGGLYYYDLTEPGYYHYFYTFGQEASDGINPVCQLTYYDNYLYGMCPTGGASNYGTIFSFDLISGVTSPNYYNGTKYSFQGLPTDGANPQASLLVDPGNGNLYGTTSAGGSGTINIGGGTLFGFGDISCYHETTEILCINGYVPISKLKTNDLVKIYNGDYKPIKYIGSRQVSQTNNNDDINSLYSLKNEYNVASFLTNPLQVSGGHYILEDIKDDGNNYKLYIEDKEMVLVSQSNKFMKVNNNNNNKLTYYHLVLDDGKECDTRYGIWANGILTESTITKYFTKNLFQQQ